MAGGTRWLLSDDRLRTPWRVVLFIALFVVIVWLEALLVPFVSQLEMPDGRLSLGLVVRTGLMLAAALGATYIMLAWVDRTPLRGLGFPLSTGWVRELGLGLGIGAAALAGVVAVFALFGGYRWVPQGGSLGGWLATSGTALVALAIPAASEEALVRGYVFRALQEGPGTWMAVALTSLVFAALHGGNPDVGPLALVNVGLAGVLLAVAVARTGTLWLATGVHLGWNWIMSGPLDLPVSGLQGLDVPLYDAVVSGPAWVTGGGFGPEGGLAGTLAASLALVLVIMFTRSDRPAVGAEE